MPTNGLMVQDHFLENGGLQVLPHLPICYGGCRTPTLEYALHQIGVSKLAAKLTQFFWGGIGKLLERWENVIFQMDNTWC